MFTEFRGMFYTSYGDDELPVPTFDDIAGGKYNNHTFFGQRWKMKIPQYIPSDIGVGDKFNTDNFNPSTAKYGLAAESPFESHGIEGNPTRLMRNENWRKTNFKFTLSKFYSIAKYQPLVNNQGSGYGYDNLNPPNDQFNNTGIIVNNDQQNDQFQYPSNNGIHPTKYIFTIRSG